MSESEITVEGAVERSVVTIAGEASLESAKHMSEEPGVVDVEEVPAFVVTSSVSKLSATLPSTTESIGKEDSVGTVMGTVANGLLVFNRGCRHTTWTFFLLIRIMGFRL